MRSFHVDNAKVSTIKPILDANTTRESYLLTDGAAQYVSIGKGFHAHLSANQGAGEYIDGPAHTNTIEGVLSIFKRGVKGVYQGCSEKHLHRYLAEFDFRCNNRTKLGIDDHESYANALWQITDKRLTYARSY